MANVPALPQWAAGWCEDEEKEGDEKEKNRGMPAASSITDPFAHVRQIWPHPITCPAWSGHMVRSLPLYSMPVFKDRVAYFAARPPPRPLRGNLWIEFVRLGFFSGTVCILEVASTSGC